MATDMTTACTRGRRGLQAAAALTVFFFSAAQAQAQTPPAPPAAPAAPAPAPTAPPAAPAPAPGSDPRALDAELPQAVEVAPSETPAPEVAPAPPPAPAEPPPPEPPPAPETAAPPPAPAPAQYGDGNLLVKDEEQANELRRKGIGVMITGGIITLAGAATSIGFTIRGTQYENLLVDSTENYNRSNCSAKVMIAEGSKCDQINDQIAKNTEGVDFSDRATRVAGAAIASGVVITVVGGIIYRLGIKKLRSGDVARVKMQPALGRGFAGLALTGRF